MGFAAGFKAGMDIGESLIDTYNTAKRQREFSDIATAKQQVSGGDLVEGTTDAVQQQLDSGAGMGEARKLSSTVTPTEYKFLGTTQNTPIDDSGMSAARVAARAGVMDKYDPEAGMRYRQQAKQGELTDMQLAQTRRAGVLADQAATDNQAYRTALMSGIPPVTATDSQPSGQRMEGATTDVQQQLAAGAGMGEARTLGTTGVVPTGQPLTPKNLQSQHNDLQTYLRNAAPAVVKTLVGQGKLEEAQRYATFMDSESGKAYATAWVTGLRKHAMGDHAGAVKSFEALYNNQLYADGNVVKIDPINGGQQYQVQMFNPEGKNIGTQVLDPKTLASQAALMLDPMRAVEFHAQQAGKRDAEAATLDRQIQLEGVRQETAGMHEDRRDARLATRIEAQSNKPAGGLTQAQQRSNAEIDAARETVSAMTPAEIRRRSSKTSDTGRENPDFDPTLARASNLANRRKVGADDVFDGRQRGSPAPQAPSADRQDVAKRFRSDPKMLSYRLGADTPNGTEVLDKSGKLVGHFK
ncbi:MAG: hypothetical protein ACOYNZ_15695 [Rhodoferax sp.]